MKMLRRFSILFAIMIAFCYSSFSQTVDEILEANLKASGTRAKIDSVKSWKIVMQIKNVADNNSITNQTMWFKKPDKFKMDITIQGKKISFGTDGETYWGKNELAGKTKYEKMPESNKEKAKEQMKQFINLLWPSSYTLKNDSFVVESMGVVDIDSRKCTKLKVTDPNTKTDQFLFIDAITNLEYKGENELSQQGKTYKIEQINSEYQKSDGIIVPRKIVVKVNGIVDNETVYQNVTVNAKIADEFFKMPADTPPTDK
jgi:outer membrane lipoprotein-sorting protein